MWELIRLVLLIALLALLVIAAVGDVRRYRISNRLCLVVAGLALPYWIATSLAGGADLLPLLAYQIGVAALVFAGFAALFALGAMGGGDVKLAAALALWVPAAQTLELVLLIALFGGLEALVLVVVRRLRGQSSRTVPYGVAIALGGCALLLEEIIKLSSV